MACKVQFMHFLCPHQPRQSIYEVTALQKHYWPQNWWFCICPPHLAIVFAHFTPLRQPNTRIWRARYNLCMFLFTHLPRQSIYEVTALQKHYLPQNLWFCIFAPRLAVIFALFAPLSRYNTKIWLSKYNVFVVSFTYPPRLSINEVTALQMHNWPENCRFCILPLIWPYFLHFLHH